MLESLAVQIRKGNAMKDHELRELINDVTAVAKNLCSLHSSYGKQISHLIVPAIKVLKERCETSDLILENGDKVIESLKKDVENLNRQLDFEAKQRTELRKDVEVAKGQYQGACIIIKQLEHDRENLKQQCEKPFRLLI